MKLSGPKLQDRVDLWVAKFDPAAVRVPPKIEDGRYVEIVPTDVGMAGIFGNIHAADGAALDQRLDALAAMVGDNDPRTSEQRRADTTGPVTRPAICPALAFCPPTVCGRWQSRPRSSGWRCPSRWHRILGIGRGPRRWNSSGGVI